MSLLWAWEKLLAEPARIEAEAREERADKDPRDEDEAAPPTLRCKACAYEGPERYCPQCLADTMVEVRRRPVVRR